VSEPLNAPAEASPCVGVCQLDARQLCTGCHRYIDEIAEWPRASLVRRIEIRRAAALRASADAANFKAGTGFSEGG
jgi:predicted Fe-S protein YdhL (DUF1289 family)